MLYIDQYGNLREPGSHAAVWGFGIPVLYRRQLDGNIDDRDIWAIPKTYFTQICAPDRYPEGKHPDDMPSKK